MEILILAFACAVGVLGLVFKFGNIRKVLSFDKWIDLAATLLLGWAFLGTFGGMVVAVIAGAIISITLLLLKKIIGYDKLTFKGWAAGPNPLEGIINESNQRNG
tara:strand:- start:149 stop:460 length:312 start_codon:yes stop_codon:yes gene_type:complete